MAIWQYGNWSKSNPSETSKFKRMKKTIMSIWNAHCIFLSILSSTFPYNALTTKTTKHKISFMLLFILVKTQKLLSFIINGCFYWEKHKCMLNIFFRIHHYELFEFINVYTLKTQTLTFFSFVRILFCKIY